MLVHGRTVTAGARVEADLCIVGAGAAGITLAKEFVGRSTRVVVLESGDVNYDPQIQALAEGANIGLPYFPLDVSRLRWVGGTTNHWGGHCRPMTAEDLERRPWVPYSGWPIRLSDIEPYYERARVACGVPNADWSLATWQRKDRYRPLPVDARRFPTGIAQIVPKDARSFFNKNRGDLETARNVTIHHGTNVTDIETDEAGRLVTLVHAGTLDGNRFSVAARQVVLAAGGIENARLLLASNRQWSRGLGNQHDLVGRFFLEHPRFVSGILAPADPHLSVGLYDDHRVGNTRIGGYLSLASEIQEAERILPVEIRLIPTYVGSFEAVADSPEMHHLDQVLETIRYRKHFDAFGRHLMNVVADLSTWKSVALPGAPLPVPFPEVVGHLMRSSPVEAQALIPDLLGNVVAGVYSKTAGAPVSSVLLRTRIDAAPNPDSRVTLGEERDAMGMPRVLLDWRLTPLDRHSVRRTLEIFGAEVGRAGLGRVKITLGEEEGVWPEDLAGGWHHIGTTRMSDDPKQGVVDRDGRVHGIDNFYVAGSSVFPTPGNGTPTLTITALAMRLADHLKGRIT